MVVVDGRQEGYSAGMNLPELASFMLEMGVKEAVNLDGGGSTSFWLDGRYRNQPSDGWPRPVANSILIYQSAQ
jgi:exopolysaccharide biosynthesis protein